MGDKTPGEGRVFPKQNTSGKPSFLDLISLYSLFYQPILPGLLWLDSSFLFKTPVVDLLGLCALTKCEMAGVISAKGRVGKI